MCRESPRSCNRQGMVLLLALLVVTTAVVVAIGLSAALTRNQAANRQANLGDLARQASQEGLAHAIATLEADYLREPGVPSHLRGRWRTDFLPIDSLKYNKTDTVTVLGVTSANTSNDMVFGCEGTAEDRNGNDTPASNLLTQHYLINQRYGFINYRGDIFSSGYMHTEGMGRWFEAGYYARNPTTAPMSFHLSHQVAVAVKAASPDPAVKRGEPVATGDPDASVAASDDAAIVDRALYLDERLKAVSTRVEARYRFRYAVAIENLDGHLLMTVPGPYDPSAADAARTATAYAARTPLEGPSSNILDMHMEMDPAVPKSYAPAFANINYLSTATDNELTKFTPAYGWLFFQGLAYDPVKGGGLGYASTGWYGIANVGTQLLAGIRPTTEFKDNSAPVLSGVNDIRATGQFPRDVSRSATTGAIIPITGARGQVAATGPMCVFDMQPRLDGVGYGHMPSYHYTPFGRGTRVGASATTYDAARTPLGCPWRVNLLTATPRTLAAMVMAYLPREFYTLQVAKRQDRTVTPAPAPTNYTTGAITTTYPEEAFPHDQYQCLSNLFDPSRNPVFPSGTGLTVPYYGTSPWFAYTDTEWTSELGKDIDLNDMTPQPNFSPRQGQSFRLHNYRANSNWTNAVAQVAGPPVIPAIPWSISVDGGFDANTHTFAGGAASRFFFKNSYYLDLATALMQALSVTQYVWLGENGASWEQITASGVVPHPDGVTRWPQVMTAGPYPGVTADALTLDPDDVSNAPYDPTKPAGAKDTPHVLNTIAKVDALFLRNLGQAPGPYPRGSRPSAPVAGVYLSKASGSFATGTLVNYKTSNTIKSLRTHPTRPITAKQASSMELVLNDMRMSFFGSSAQYPDPLYDPAFDADFRPIDFDDDGVVRCSCYGSYSGTPAAAMADPATGYGPTPPIRFSLTGHFVFSKARFFRLFIRGELFDELRGISVARSDIEAAYVVDPDGSERDLYNRATPTSGGMGDSHLLYKRNIWNFFAGDQSIYTGE